MKNLDDFQLLTIIKTSSDEDEVNNAKKVLWERYIPFVGQKFFKWRDSLVRVNISKEDYMNEAYLRFCRTVDMFDLNGKAKKLSTILFYSLFKIKNDADDEWRRRGCKTTHFSDYDRPENDTSFDEYNNELVEAMSVDFDSKYNDYVASETISEYRRNEKDKEKIFILDSMLDGVPTAEIIRILSENKRKCDVKRMIESVKDTIKSIALKNGFCYA